MTRRLDSAHYWGSVGSNDYLAHDGMRHYSDSGCRYGRHWRYVTLSIFLK